MPEDSYSAPTPSPAADLRGTPGNRGGGAIVVQEGSSCSVVLTCLVWAHAWVAGQVPSWGPGRGDQLTPLTRMFLSLSFSLPSPL